MKTVLRAVVLVASVIAIAMAGAAGVRAADPSATPPALIGGALDAKSEAVTLTSTATMPVAVAMTTDGPFTLTPTEFTLDPGETMTMAVTGDARGRISASLSILDANIDGDTSSVTLNVAFPLPAPWTPPWNLILGALALAGVLVVVAVRVRRFAATYAIVKRA